LFCFVLEEHGATPHNWPNDEAVPLFLLPMWSLVVVRAVSSLLASAETPFPCSERRALLSSYLYLWFWRFFSHGIPLSRLFESVLVIRDFVWSHVKRARPLDCVISGLSLDLVSFSDNKIASAFHCFTKRLIATDG
jgi:hypothetical protein